MYIYVAVQINITVVQGTNYLCMVEYMYTYAKIETKHCKAIFTGTSIYLNI